MYSRPRDLRIGTFAEFIAIDATTWRSSRGRCRSRKPAPYPSWRWPRGRPSPTWLGQTRPEGSRPCRSRRARVHGHPGRQAPRRLRRHHREHQGPGQGPRVRRRRSHRLHPAGFRRRTERLRRRPRLPRRPNLEKSLTVLKPGGLAISVAGPPEPTFAKQLGAADARAGHGGPQPQGPQAGQEAGGALLVPLHARQTAHNSRPSQPCTTTAPCVPCWTAPSNSTRPCKRWRMSTRQGQREDLVTR